MDIYLGYTSALAYWRANRRSLALGASFLDDAKPLDLSVDAVPASRFARAQAPTRQACEDLMRAGVASCANEPLQLVVSHKNKIRHLEGARVHVHAAGLPKGSFVEVGNGCCVSSPELTFLELASVVSLPRLIQLGHELCGTYCLDAESGAAMYKVCPITSTSRLLAYLEHAKGIAGVKAAKAALRHVADRSASPRETLVSMLLSLPERLGGYGIVPPELNYRIDVSRRAHKGADGSYYVCDLYWPQHRLAVEYDSSEFHELRPSIAHDSMRRSELAYLGIQVVSVTNEQVKDWRAFDKVAQLVARVTGKRIRCRSTRFDVWAQRMALRKELLVP